MKNSRILAAAWMGLAAGAVMAASEGERLPVGEFVATRFDKAPVIDGVAAPGEWDRALTTEGLIAPFEHQLQESVTVMSLGFDADNLYFLFRCRRGNFEWKLWKLARQNDDYNFGDSSVEIWVSPPAMVPETYQNVINTYPAVLDQKMIPSRGYTAQGWKAGWKLGVKESESDYVVEASVPIRDFGHETIRNGDVWRFILARTVHGAKPRAQASWSITQGFSEIAQHPPVRMMDDEAVLQLTGVHTLFTGKYRLPVGVAAPRNAGADVDLELRFQRGKNPDAADRVETKRVSVKAGARAEALFEGDVTEWTPADAKGVKRGYMTLTGKRGQTVLFRQSFPYEISGWTPQAPVKPEKAAAVEELAITALYGPETDTVLVKADIFDLPGREKAASAEAKILDPGTGKVLASQATRPFQSWYSGAEIKLKGVDIPVDDFRKVKDLRVEDKAIADRNSAHKKAGEPLEKRLEIPKTPGKKVQVVVTVKDQAGAELRTASKDIELLRYSAEWMNNTVGVSDKVIPPWSPVEVKGADVKVWNRTLTLDGLGLARQVVNGGEPQLAAPMRLVAVRDGQEIELKGGDPKVARRVEAEADLTGESQAAGVRFTARTRVEFDGFVNVVMDVAPAAKEPVTLEKLFLEIILPEGKASHYCTTAGGWAAVHDATPDYWSSQTTASGMLVGDFVPYVWLTDSDTAFLWFADHDKGWNHDPEKKLPTQELIRKDGKVVLRIHFFEIPTQVAAPRTLTWGWQTFPSRPLPSGWRATYCANSSPTANTKNTYFWTDADWAVLWPYYCSPFPWHMDKSKEMLANATRDPRHRPSVGSIAHSIGRYKDYEGNDFPGLAVDWGATPGQIGNSDVTASRGPNDFRLWHYQRWVKEAGFRSLYVDENYLALEDNFLTGNAYWREDGLLQRGYNYLGLRNYFKRMKYMFHENGVTEPNLWQHISSGAAYHSWFGNVFFEGENVEPTDLTFDYMEVLPAGRLRAIGSSVCAGGAMTMMCQSTRHKTQWWEKHTHQFLGWVMAHDVLPEQLPVFPHIAEAAHLWSDKVTFRPYWKKGPFSVNVKDCLVSAHQADGRAMLWVVNTTRKDEKVAVSIDWKAAGLDPAAVMAVNAETGEPVPLTASGFTVPVLQRDFTGVLIAPAGPSGATFSASFDKGVEADYALYTTALDAGRRGGPLARVADGKGGQALDMTNGAVSVRTFLQLADGEGKVSGRFLLGEKRNGSLLKLGPLGVEMKQGKDAALNLVLDPVAKGDATRVTVAAVLPEAGWHDLSLAWKAGVARLSVDGNVVTEMPIRPLGLDKTDEPLKMPALELGGRGGLLAVDDLRLSRKAD